MTKIPQLKLKGGLNALNPTALVNSFKFKVTFYLIAIIGSAALAVQGHPASFIFGVLGLGLTLAHGTELAHQALHQTGFKQPILNSIFGTLSSTLTLVSFSAYRWSHLAHHRYNGSDQDAESFGYDYSLMQSDKFAKRLTGLIRHLLMLGHFKTAILRISALLTGKIDKQLSAAYPKMNAKIRHRIRRDYIFTLLLIASVVSGSIFLADPQPVFVMLGGWLVWAPVHALIETPEHWETGERPVLDSFGNTRTIVAHPILNYFTNGNCFHVEHHNNASIPMSQLRDYHVTLMKSGHVFHHIEKSYLSFFGRFFSSVIAGPTSPHSPESKK